MAHKRGITDRSYFLMTLLTLIRAKGLFGFCLSAVLFLVPAFVTAQGATIYVSENQSLQKAIDAAADGDTVILKDGVYYETIEITRPITLKAEHGGKATITNAYRGKLRFTPLRGASGLYCAEVGWPVHWVMAGDRNLYDYRQLKALKSFTMLPQYCRLDRPASGPHEGFAWENGKLYIRLKNKQNPNKADIEINSSKMDGQSHFLKNNGLEAMEPFIRPCSGPLRLVYADHIKLLDYPEDLGIIVSVDSDEVVIEGLRFHLAPHVAIDVKKGKNVTIRDCFFDGFQYAINTGEQCQNLTVEYSEFSGGRLYERYRAHTRHMDNRYWAGVYFSNLEINAVAQKGPGLVFRHNYVYEGFDGIQPRGIAPELIGKLPDIPSDISYNVFMNFVDNNLEPDGWTRLLNLRVHHNLVIDGRCMLSCAPIQRGPLQIDHNLFYNSPEYGVSGGVLLKHIQPASAAAVNTGLTVVHNTFVLPRKSLHSQGSTAQYKDNMIENNIMVVEKSSPWSHSGFTPSSYNLIFGPYVSDEHLPHCLHKDPGLVGLRPVDFRLSKTSAAIGAGINRDRAYYHQSIDTTDLGAIEYGSTWEFPTPGPRWATARNMPQRPVWPASISPRWAGLEP